MQGQEWTTIEALVEEGHHNKVQDIEPGALRTGLAVRIGLRYVRVLLL